tara:strand:+ start:351 stop:686 length:336 start_codon:yes stop_codon:yes gene_type:complete
MPTKFTDCKECYYFNDLEKYKRTHICFKEIYLLYNENLEKQQILTYFFSIPEEIAIIIVKMANNLDLKRCGYCNSKLCKLHADQGSLYNKFFKRTPNKILCKDCRWQENTI